MTISKSTLGVILTLAFVVLESAQFVFFGGLFQKMSPYLFGFLVFGVMTLVFVGGTILFQREQFNIAISRPRELLAVNLGAVVTFTAYLTSVQLVEPAITYTISSGTMPIAAYVFYRFGMREGEPMRNSLEAAGNLIIFLGITFLAAITVLGWTGFVRSGQWSAALGVLLAVIDGVFFTLILVYSQRMNKSGVGPSAVLGLRLPIYVMATGFFVYLDFEPSQPMAVPELAYYVVIGFLLTVPPLYLLQKAVPMISTLTLSALTALGPFVVFSLQLYEGRVDYSTATLIGLSIYIVGAILAAVGAVRGASMSGA
ncbi:MAG: hypothetical protein GKR96_09735 [Gammaproteobacteria bacterium]|nr:hypothetical protein [Gammaproteobacteria bacterium]